jgi:hypothetical protein
LSFSLWFDSPPLSCLRMADNRIQYIVSFPILKVEL